MQPRDISPNLIHAGSHWASLPFPGAIGYYNLNSGYQSTHLKGYANGRLAAIES